MIMANFQKGSVCLICSSKTDNINNDSNFNSEVFSKFLRFVSRYLSYGHNSFNSDKIHQFFANHKSPGACSILKCCDICVEKVTRFLKVYENFELIQLELLNILDHISTTMLMSCSGNKPKYISDFQVALTKLVEETRTQRLPVVKIERLGTGNTRNENILSEDEAELPFSVDHLKLEPFPFEDDHDDTDFEDFHPDSNFEINSPKDLQESLEDETKPITVTVKINFEDFHQDPNFEINSPEDLPESLENEDESKPIILKTENIKIDYDANRLDHEEEIPSSKDWSPNHQISTRKLHPNLAKLRLKNKSKNRCLFCSETHGKPYQLFRHIQCHIGERPHQCKRCSQEFRDKHCLRRHVISVHYTNDDSGGNRPEPVKDKPCPICGKLFVSNSDVQKHISYIHTGVKNFKCEHENCSKAFVRRSDLNKHLVAHTDLKPFQCNICHKMFKREYEMSRHKVVQHDNEVVKKEIPTECSVCGKIFRRMRQLRVHRARHHPDIFKEDRESLMKFKCPHAPCDKKFFSKYYLKKHIRHKHDCIKSEVV